MLHCHGVLDLGSSWLLERQSLRSVLMNPGSRESSVLVDGPGSDRGITKYVLADRGFERGVFEGVKESPSFGIRH